MKKSHVYPFLSRGSAFLAESVKDKGLLLKVMYQDKTKEFFSTTPQSFLSQMIQFFGYDIMALRKQYGQAIGKRQMIPLPLLEDWILVPFKLSTTMDGEYFSGWVVAQTMIRMEEENKGVTKLYLEGDHIVYCAHSQAFCDQQIRHVALVQHRYQLLHQKGNFVKEGRLSYFR